MSDEPLRVGFVGVGGRGSSHASVVDDGPHQVVAGADVSDETRANFAAQYDADPYETHEELYASADLDAVVVSTPNTFHAPAAVDALEADLPVLVEKPLADGLDAAERIAAADADSEAFCMVGFQRRFSPAVRLVTELRESGRFGDLRHVEATYRRRRGVPGVGSWFTDEDLAGGGALIDLGVHAIDLALYLLDFPEVTWVSGETRSDFGGDPDYADPQGWGDNWSQSGDQTFDVDDSALAFCRTADGQTLSFDVAWATNADGGAGIEIRGTEAGAELGLGGTDVDLYDAGTGAVDHFEDVTLSGRETGSGRAQMETFLDGVRTGTRPDVNTVSEGVAVQRVIDAIYRSSEAGEPVSLS